MTEVLPEVKPEVNPEGLPEVMAEEVLPEEEKRRPFYYLPGWKSSWNGNVFRFVLAIVAGLLLLDNTYLIEETSCVPGRSSVESCPDEYFSQTYLQARRRFRLAAQAAGAKLERYVMVEADGVEYTTDVAVLEGTSKNETAMIHVVGLQGVGGYAGSAAQLLMLEKWSTCPNVVGDEEELAKKYAPESLGRAATVVLVHVVSPYGMAKNRMTDHENVDLMRNFIYTDEEWKEVLSRDPDVEGFESYASLVESQDPTWTPSLWNRYYYLIRIGWYVVRQGYSQLIRSVLSGQYHRPQNIAFGGVKLQPGSRLVADIARRFEGSRRVAVVMFSSGMGDSGQSTLIVPTVVEADYVKGIYADHHVSPRNRPTKDLTWATPNMRGVPDFRKYYKHIGSGAEVVDFVQTIGTTHEFIMGRNWVLENAAHFLTRDTYGHMMMALWLRDSFYPQRLSWKRRALEESERCVEDTLRLFLEA